MQESPRSPPLFLQDENLSKHLFFGFQLIREGTFLLDLQLSLSVDAQELLVDFYSNNKSLEVYDVFSVSMACFLIASKAEGLKLSLRDVVLLFHFLHSHHRLNRGLSLSLSPEKETSEIIHAKLSRLDLSSAEYGGWKQELAGMEREVLTELGYRVQRDNEGFKYLESTILSLQLSEEDTSTLLRASFKLLNDFFFVVPLYSFNTLVLTCSAVFLSLLSFSSQPEVPKNWWMYFGVTLEDLMLVCEDFFRFTSKKKAYFVPPISPVPYLE